MPLISILLRLGKRGREMINNIAFINDVVVDLDDLCYLICQMFGQDAVLNFINDRQGTGDLEYVQWALCASCKITSPMNFDFEGYSCLVCGTRPYLSPLTGERQ
jgi:hypothetical protein